jgi:protein ImuA
MGLDWDLRVRVVKRKGPTHDQDLLLPAYAGGIANALTPELRHPSRLHDKPISIEAPHVSVVGSTPTPSRPDTAHH